MTIGNQNQTPSLSPSIFFFLFSIYLSSSSSQKTCPNCGSMEVPYPLSTNPKCGDPIYALLCDHLTQKLYFQALNGSSYLVLSVEATAQRMVVKPSPWVPSTCITQDMLKSEGIWLNQSLPFNITSSNTIFLFNCSPRLLVSPLNCTRTSLCHRYLGGLGSIQPLQCANELVPCCTFVAGGLPSAYKIRLHTSGCQAFRSILHLDPEKPVTKWEEGLEIQWASPPEPVCRTQLDCSKNSTCSTVKRGLKRCLCNSGYYWDHALGDCLGKFHHSKSSITHHSLNIMTGLLASFMIFVGISVIVVGRTRKFSHKSKLARAREDMLKASNDGKSARIFSLKEIKKATCGFSKEKILGVGGFGEVYKGVLHDGTVVAVKSAKVGNVKSTQQVLNEVGILSQVNHKNLVKLLGVCVEAEQPLMIYEYISKGTLHDHLHKKDAAFLDLKTRLNIALQTGEALAYLHSSTHTPIYHRDVKSTNILLEENLTAKVADFGLSRLAEPGLSHVSTCAQGTLGYLDPEYFRNYQLTDKSDVYSYGVVLLELLTSEKAIDFSRDHDDANLVMYVVQRADKGLIMEVIDRRLLGNEPSVGVMKSVTLFGELALACLREKKEDRPCMKVVVQELQCIMGMLDQGEERVGVKNKA